MQFLKKNYEKILLAVIVLAALAVVLFLTILVSNEKKRLDDLTNSYLPKHPKAFPPLDLKAYQDLQVRAQTRVSLDFSSSNRIFNPVRWQMGRDGKIFPNPAGREIEKLQVTKLSPLHFIVSLESVSATPGLATHYGIGLTHEAALLVSQRSKKLTYAPLNETTNGFTVLSAEGSEDDPTSVTLELSEPAQKVTISKEQPFKRVEGYSVDMFYQPENRHFLPNRRVGDVVNFAGESYKIIDIKESEVVLLQQSNQKQWIEKFTLTNASSTATSP
jgi:hypothetical protein